MTMENSKSISMNSLPVDVLTSLAVRANGDKNLTRALKELHHAAKSSLQNEEEENQLLPRLYKCSLQLMDVDNNGKVSLREYIPYLGPRVYYEIHGDTTNKVDVVWPYLHFVVATQAIVALCIGSFLSTALLMVRRNCLPHALTK